MVDNNTIVFLQSKEDGLLAYSIPNRNPILMLAQTNESLSLLFIFLVLLFFI
jgi:hypothetical protein